MSPVFERCPRQAKGFRGQDRIKMKTLGKEVVQINRENIDLRYVEQLTDSEQVSALGYCVKFAVQNLFDGRTRMQDVVKKLAENIDIDGLAGLCESRSNVVNLAMPREQEIFACLNRYRGMEI